MAQWKLVKVWNLENQFFSKYCQKSHESESSKKCCLKRNANVQKIPGIYWFPPNWWHIAHWWRFEIWEIDFFQTIDKKHIKVSKVKSVGSNEMQKSKNSKETKYQRQFNFSLSSITFWYKVEATTALLGWFKIHTSDTNSTFNMESKTHQRILFKRQ